MRNWTRWTPLLLTLLALAWRMILSAQYYGWEESDYGNLAMARGAFESGFTDFDMKHLPFYYFLSGLFVALLDDSIWATHIVSVGTGAMSIGLVYLIGRRAFDETVALSAALILCVQSEYALYASSSLREPLFGFLVLLGAHLLLENRPRGAAWASSFSFLTRFDSMLIALPATLYHVVRRPPSLKSLRHPLWSMLAIYGGVVFLWAWYCSVHHGTWLFFMPTVEVNLETGGGHELRTPMERLQGGLEVVRALFFSTMPNHLSYPIWLGALLGLWLHRRELFARTARGTLFAYGFLNTGFWLGIGLVGQHEPEHNLYWKWLYPLMPWWVLFACSAGVWVVRALPQRALRGALVLLVVVMMGNTYARETHRQLILSEQLLKPQVELARWVEAHVPPGTSMVFDNIPACYLNRKPHTWLLISWFDVPVPRDDEASMAAWLREQRIRYVLWFQEDWTQAPLIAPYLRDPRIHVLDGLHLTPLFQDAAYGFVFYEVQVTDGEALP
ncbi:MAG: glycosyltransferase family 39 protein [Myxococcota bacterium]